MSQENGEQFIVNGQTAWKTRSALFLGWDFLYQTQGWFTVVEPIEVEDDVEFPVCTPTLFPIGDLDEIDAPIDEITGCNVPASLAPCSFVPGSGNAGTLTIHCLKKGTGPGTITFIPMWTGDGPGNNTERTVKFNLVCE